MRTFCLLSTVVAAFLCLGPIAPAAPPDVSVPDAVTTLCDEVIAHPTDDVEEGPARKALGSAQKKMQKALTKLAQGKKSSLKASLGGVGGATKKLEKAGIAGLFTVATQGVVDAVNGDVGQKEDQIAGRLAADEALKDKFTRKFDKAKSKVEKWEAILAGGDTPKFLKKSGGIIMGLEKLIAKIDKAAGPPPANPDAGKGKVVLGPIAGGDFEIHDLSDLAAGPIASGLTTSGNLDEAGRIEVDPLLFADAKLYLVVVTGGSDIDADDDGVLDAVPTVVNGEVHGVLTGAQIKAGDWRLSILTEVAYQSVLYLLEAGYADEDILAALDQAARRLLHTDLNGDGEVDSNDLNQWDPVLNAGWSALTEDQTEELVAQIHAGGDTSAAAHESTSAWVGWNDTITYSRDIEVVGSLAYLACDTVGLAVVDLSDPTEPEWLGSAWTQHKKGYDVEVSGDNAYLETNMELYLIDVSNPASPYSYWRYAGVLPYAMKAHGDFLYYTTKDNFVAVDVSFRTDGDDQTTEPVVTTFPFYGTYGDLHIKGDELFVPYAGKKLAIFDLSESGEPTLNRYVNLPVSSSGFFHGDNLYRAYGGTPRRAMLEVVELGDLTDPTLVATLPLPFSQLTGRAASGNVIYLLTLDGIVTVDVSTPAEPVVSGRIYTGSHSSGALGIYGDDHPYALINKDENFNNALSELHVYDVADTSIKGVAGSVRLDPFANGMDLIGSTAYVAGHEKVGSLEIVDLSDPTAPSRVGGLEIPNVVNPTHKEEIFDVAVLGNHALVGGFNALHVVDVGTPATPTLLDSDPTFLQAWGVLPGRGNFAYLSSYGVHQIDATNPEAIVAGGATIRGDQEQVYDVVPGTSSDTVYSFDINGSNRLDVFSFTSGTGDPTSLGSHTTPDFVDALGIDVVGDTAFVVVVDAVDWTYSLLALDVGTPGSISEIGRVPIDGGAKIRVAGDLAVVADPRFGIRVYDISDPTAIEKVGETVTLGGADEIEIYGDLVIVANRFGVEVVRLPVREVP